MQRRQQRNKRGNLRVSRSGADFRKELGDSPLNLARILAVAHKLAQTMGERWERECDNFLWSLELEEFNSLGQECKNHPSLPDFVEEVEKVYKEKFEFMGKNGEPIEDLIQFVLYLVRQEEVEGVLEDAMLKPWVLPNG